MTLAEQPRTFALDGAVNFRDFGGYPTADGRRVRRGMLYRSGAMNRLTDASATTIAGLGIATIVDFRTSNERQIQPTSWHEGSATEYLFHDHEASSGKLDNLVNAALQSADHARASMINIYRSLASDHAPSYRRMFERLAAGRVPMLINCSAGKDRTGIGAILVLTALDVPRDTIIEDYLLTNQADFSPLFTNNHSRLAKLVAEAPESVAPLLSVHADYLATLFDTLDRNHGGIDGYLRDVLGVDDAVRQRLADHLLEP